MVKYSSLKKSIDLVISIKKFESQLQLLSKYTDYSNTTIYVNGSYSINTGYGDMSFNNADLIAMIKMMIESKKKELEALGVEIDE